MNVNTDHKRVVVYIPEDDDVELFEPELVDQLEQEEQTDEEEDVKPIIKQEPSSSSSTLDLAEAVVGSECSEEETCDICHEIFRSREKLKAHHRQQHSVDRPYKCRNCFKSFYTIFDLQSHRKCHWHYLKARFKCEQCERYFLKESRLKSHSTKVHSKKSIRCDICSQFFDTRYEYTVHMKKVHLSVAKPTVCNICGDSFANELRLQTHYYIRHKETTKEQLNTKKEMKTYSKRQKNDES